MTEAPAYLLIGAAVLFLLFIGAQALWPVASPAASAARKKHSLAISEGTDKKRPVEERVAALVRAGRIALGELGRPRLAARHAEWAHRLVPHDPEVIALAVDALTRARRLHALERLLWQSADGDRDHAARDALIALYDGPLKQPVRARVLRHWSHATGAHATGAHATGAHATGAHATGAHGTTSTERSNERVDTPRKERA